MGGEGAALIRVVAMDQMGVSLQSDYQRALAEK
jgi:hypothetical protein